MNYNYPTCIEHYSDLTIKSEEYRKEGELHNEDGPAFTHYDEDGTILSELWFQNGLLHNENGPSIFNKDIQIWYINGKRHRTNGEPCIIYSDENIKDEYWYDGKKLIEGSIEYKKYICEVRKNKLLIIKDAR